MPTCFHAARPLGFFMVLVIACMTRLAPAQQNVPDFKTMVARADLDYETPAARSEEGMPIGNGRMGTLVWTTPGAMHMQINRVDVFACDSSTQSFTRTNTDYASGCAFIDINCPAPFGAKDETFAPGSNFKQHLSCYEGLMTAQGAGVSVRAIASQNSDVFALEVDDEREQAAGTAPISLDLRILRYHALLVRGQRFPATNPHSNTVQTGGQTATSALEIIDGRIVLTQQFREREFYSASAVAVTIVGRASKAEYQNEMTVRLTAAPGKGKFLILISSAASFDRRADVAAAAIKELDSAVKKTFDQIIAHARAWWDGFWPKAYVSLHSDDGVADMVEANYNYFLYVMASCSRGGDYPARFGGMLWYSNGDLRAWGSQYWWANQSCYYNGLAPTNRFELLDPTFSMYSKMYDAEEVAAQQQWGSKGIWIPETSFFNGEPRLPDDIATEMRELYLMQKPWDQHSQKFEDYAYGMLSHNSRWNWMAQDGRWELGRWIPNTKGAPPFGHVTHIFGTTAKIAYLYWQRFEYAQDAGWLRDRAYPMLKGTVEFYRNFPNLKKDADGKYHIYHTNSNEPAWGVKDSDEDLSAMRGVIGPAIRAAETLKVDAEMIPVWKEFLANLAPIPTSDNPDALKPENYNGPRVWIKGLKPAVKPGGLLPDGNTMPQWNYDLCTVNMTDQPTLELANATYDAFFRGRRGGGGAASTQPEEPPGIGPRSRPGTLSRLAIAGAQLGRVEATKYLIPNQISFVERGDVSDTNVFRNRMSLREGPGATDCQRLGRAAEALHYALLQSAPPTPGGESIIRLFPAWPKEWDASFKLLTRGAFLVSASFKNGSIQSVEIESQAGGECRIVNPWPGAPVTLHRDGAASEKLSGELLKFLTRKGEKLVLVR
jgi:hypothetical protein